MARILKWLTSSVISPVGISRWAMASIALAVGIIVYGIFHTLDWTDESWALSLISTNRTTVGEPWAFQYLIHPIFSALGGSIIALRFVRLCAYLGLGILAAWVVSRIAETKGYQLSRTHRVFVHLAAQAGTLLAWAWPPRYFAYNELASIGVQTVALLIAILLVSGEKSSRRTIARGKVFTLWTVAGAVIGLLFFAKFTAFILLAPVLLVAALLSNSTSRMLNVVSGGGGIVAGIGIPFLSGLPLSEYISSVLANIFDETVRVANVHPSGLVGMYISNLWGLVQFMAPAAFLLLAAAILIIGVIPESADVKGVLPRFAQIALVMLGIMAMAHVALGGSGADRTGRLATVLAVAAFTVLAFLAWRPIRGLVSLDENTSTIRSWAAIALLAVAPVVVSAGTNNPLTLHFGFGSTVWAAGFGIAMVLWHQVLKARGVKFNVYPLIAIALTLTLAAFLVVKDAQAPYRSASFKSNTAPIGIEGPYAGLYVTPAEANWAQWLQRQASELKAESTPTLSLKNAGALVAFNNSDFASPWLESFWPASYWSIERACESTTVDDLIIIQPGTAPLGSADVTMMADSLSKSCGINFPADFSRVATYKSPTASFYTTIWRLTN